MNTLDTLLFSFVGLTLLIAISFAAVAMEQRHEIERFSACAEKIEPEKCIAILGVK